MQEGLHPEYHNDTVVKCACGNTFTTGSVKEELKVDVCSKCHPFYTGKQKNIDAGGRVDRFMKKFNIKNELENDAE
jgi:large subunit ribosomal protein L31